MSETKGGLRRGREGEKGEDTGNKLSIVLLPYNGRPIGGTTGTFTYPPLSVQTLFPSSLILPSSLPSLFHLLINLTSTLFHTSNPSLFPVYYLVELTQTQNTSHVRNPVVPFPIS